MFDVANLTYLAIFARCMSYHDMMIHNKIRSEHRSETLGKYFFCNLFHDCSHKKNSRRLGCKLEKIWSVLFFLSYFLTITFFCYRLAVKNACLMLMNLGIGSRNVYEEDFEKRFLNESASFYKVLVLSIQLLLSVQKVCTWKLLMTFGRELRIDPRF